MVSSSEKTAESNIRRRTQEKTFRGQWIEGSTQELNFAPPALSCPADMEVFILDSTDFFAEDSSHSPLAFLDLSSASGAGERPEAHRGSLVWAHWLDKYNVCVLVPALRHTWIPF